jgi:hypothetical protein
MFYAVALFYGNEFERVGAQLALGYMPDLDKTSPILSISIPLIATIVPQVLCSFFLFFSFLFFSFLFFSFLFFSFLFFSLAFSLFFLSMLFSLLLSAYLTLFFFFLFSF